MPVIPTGYAQVNLIFTGSQIPTGAEITMGFDLEIYAGSATGLAGDVGGIFASGIMPNLNASCTLSGALAKFGPSATGPSGEQTFSTVGGDGGAACSPGVTYLVQKVTNDGGRAGRGRWYVPGCSEADVSGNGEIDATFLAQMQSDLDAFLVSITAADLTPVVLHGAESPLSVPSPITGLVIDNRVATQRKRQRR